MPVPLKRPASYLGGYHLATHKGRLDAAPCVSFSDVYPWIETSTGIMRIATMFAILIIGLIAGPAVSL